MSHGRRLFSAAHARCVLTGISTTLVLCVACKHGNSPTSPPPDAACEPTGPAPETTWFSLTSSLSGGTDLGTDVTWNRDTGVLSFPTAHGTIVVSEPTRAIDGAGCTVEVTQAAFESFEHRPEQSAAFVILDHLGFSTISGTVDMLLYASALVDTVRVAFSVAGDRCVLGEGAPGVGQYWLESFAFGAPGSPKATYGGVVTRWDRNLGLVVLGEEDVPDSSPRWGMNLWVVEPVRQVGTERVVTLLRAELVVADSGSGTPEEINVRFFQFPPEAGYPTDENNLIRVGFLSNGAISATGEIPMQRQTFSPTGGAVWHEEITLRACFDALELQ